MILLTYRNEETNEEKMTTFNNWQEYNNFVFSPVYTPLFVTDFKIKGKIYQERKANAETIAIDYSNNQAPGLYWSEVAEIGEKFYTIGKRYGLLTEFKENAIC